jgi:uroporphyrinogen-III synthase
MLVWNYAVSLAQNFQYSMRLLITRPDEDAKPLAALLEKLGHKTISEALMIINNLTPLDIDLSGIQALLITSANGIRALASAHKDRSILIYAVGDASASVARKLGYKKVNSAAGNVETLATMIKKKLEPTDGPLIHVAGTYLMGDLAEILIADGFEVRREVLYKAKAVNELGPKTKDALKNKKIDGVLFFSPRTATLFCRFVTKSKLFEQCRPLTAFCLSAAVAKEAAMLPWASVIVAKNPDNNALLDTIPKNSWPNV